MRPLQHLVQIWSLRNPTTTLASSRSLLAEVERSAERALHVLRGGLWTIGFAFFFVAFRSLSDIPWALAIPYALAAFAWWLIIWRVLARPSPPPQLRYALILYDCFFMVQFVPLPIPVLYRLLWPVPQAVLQEATVGLVPPLLVLIALSGALRIEPRAAVLSSTAALVTYLIVAVSLHVPLQQSLPPGVALVLSGMASVVTAQVLRDAFLRARWQDILEHYVPGSLTRELLRTGDVAHAAREEELSVLLADIRGFTTLTESLSPAEAVAFLNAYLVRAIPPLVAEGAVIDKYIGDGILAFFEGEGHKQRAVRAARALLGAVEDSNSSRASQDALRVGVALHTGRAMVGTIGTEERREYTVISDTVNVTARLEELNKRYGSCIVASEPVLAACEDGLRWGFAGPSSVEIRGRDTALSVYYLPRTP